jgi:hypothetical protein
MNDGLMRTNGALVCKNDLRDTPQVSWLMRMSDALVRMNDAFVRKNAALVRMNDSLVRTKGGIAEVLDRKKTIPPRLKPDSFWRFLRHG